MAIVENGARRGNQRQQRSGRVEMELNRGIHHEDLREGPAQAFSRGLDNNIRRIRNFFRR